MVEYPIVPGAKCAKGDESMDLLKVLLLYMTMVVTSSTEAAPSVTPFPTEMLPTATPYVTQAPTLVPTSVPTPVPTATPVPYTTLYVGDRGDGVKKLQRRLTELGYLNDKIDGIYGQNTKKAVERFQYYNNLKVDGIAGKATQSLLFENPSVVTAPPEITPGPTATTPVSVNVPVYYVDQNGQLITRVVMTCYGTTTIYANSNNVSSDYTLDSSGAVTVAVQNGVATPASVTFRYKLKTTAAPTASTVTIPVYYVNTNGTVLHQTSATMSRGYTSYVLFSPSLVSNAYELVGEDRQAVSVNANGVATPASVVFTLRLRATQAPTAVPTQAPTAVPSHQEAIVYYVNESGVTLNQEVRLLPVGQISYLSPNAALAPLGYSLISPSTITVSITEQGVQRPERIVFLYSILPTEAPTASPTAVPTAEPTAVPTETPTAEPTAVPTEEPTPVPTEEPAPVPTEEPTPVPTEEPTPVPTKEPTPVPTKEPTPVPTEEPSPVPTEEPSPVPTEEPSPVPTEEPSPVPTEEPSPVPTEEPTPVPTEVPTPVPTEEPTPIPTEEPTPAPTEVPVPADGLMQAGSTVTLNGNQMVLPWYKDENGQILINLQQLATAAGWGYTPNAGTPEMICGCEVLTSYGADGIYILTVNRENQYDNGRIWNNDLYVNLAFLEKLGAQTASDGTALTLTFPQ
ncbi:MAG: hypothetical protein E7329_07005 [Clostridiales bacterium]|nr:hypothetical protein [Clostridiales bacterium]